VAKDKGKKTDTDVGTKPSIIAVILPVLLLTLIAAGGGFAVATLSGSNPPAAQTAPIAGAEGAIANPETSKPTEETAGKEPNVNAGIVRQLAPIVTNLASPKDTWMRIEVSLVINPEAQAEQDMIAVKSSDQILTMLRTIDLSQIEGPSGFLHFKEDINDLLKENSENKIRQALIVSMVVE
jgi:flagellar protein FliL